MAGPIQTSIGSLLNTAAAGLTVVKKMNENERQADEKAAKEQQAAQREAERKAKAEEAEAAAEAKAEADKKEERKVARATLKEEKREAEAVATEADIRLLGGSPEAAEAYRLAQERGLANPKSIIYGKDKKPIATYEEMAMILADQSLSGSVSSLLRGKGAVKNRRMLLQGKTHKQRVEEAVLASGGSK